jgi:hypothetical protein
MLFPTLKVKKYHLSVKLQLFIIPIINSPRLVFNFKKKKLTEYEEEILI